MLKSLLASFCPSLSLEESQLLGASPRVITGQLMEAGEEILLQPYFNYHSPTSAFLPSSQHMQPHVAGHRTEIRQETSHRAKQPIRILLSNKVLVRCPSLLQALCSAHTSCSILPAEILDEAKRQGVTLSTSQAGPTPCLDKPFMMACQSLRRKTKNN